MNKQEIIRQLDSLMGTYVYDGDTKESNALYDAIKILERIDEEKIKTVLCKSCDNCIYSCSEECSMVDRKAKSIYNYLMEGK